MEIWKSKKKMDGDVRSIFHGGSYRRMASIAVLSFCILCAPQNVLCLVNEHITGKEILDIDDIEQKFDDLEKSISESDDPLAGGRKFLESFLKEVESRYGIALTIPQACQLVKDKIHTLQIPEQAVKPLLITIDLFLEEPEGKEQPSPTMSHKNFGVSNAMQKSWDHFRGKKHRVAALDPNIELPGNVYIGGVEMFSAVLVCLLPFPGSFSIGGAMFLDGMRRVFEGYVQANDEERLGRTFFNAP